MEREVLLGRSEQELQDCALRIGLKRFVGKQLAQWIYSKRVVDFAQMTNISLPGREALSRAYILGREAYLRSVTSRDGTRKYLFPVGHGRTVETAMIPDRERRTLCVSSQSGCRMGCRFCATGRQTWGGNLSSGQILNTILSVDEASDLTNIVFMGMGEPLDNVVEVLRALEALTSPWGLAMSPRRITVSTVGVEPGLSQFLRMSECHLAVSLHSPFETERREIVPASRALPIGSLMDRLRTCDWSGQRRLSFEYVVLRGVNDTDRHVDALARLLRPIPCLVNLIAFHPHPEAPYAAPAPEALEHFRDRLNQRGIRATVRTSRGQDIEAACGLLARVTEAGG